MFEQTYRIEVPPAPSMPWETYEKTLLADWSSMLASTPGPTERELQTFLERHPSLVPGALTVHGAPTGHYPWRAALFSQAPLPSYGHRVPDFMWITLNSDTESPLLIEIEAPQKRWFTSSGVATSELNQALDQIAEWKAWFAVPHNVQAFKAFYRLDEVAWMQRRFRPAYMLVYGRRTEANATPALTAKRTHIIPEDVAVMTYDRLRPDYHASQYVCVKPSVTGTLTALSVPPTLKWSPGLAEDRMAITGLDSAILRNEDIEHSRRDFLVRRLPYWNAWASQPHRGSHSDDAE